MPDDKQDSDYRPQPHVPPPLPGLDAIDQQATNAGVQALFRAVRNSLTTAFDDYAIGPDSRFTLYLKPPPPANPVPLIRVQIAPGTLALDLDPTVLLRKLKIPETTLDDFLAVLPAHQTDLGSRRLRIYFTNPAEIVRLSTYLTAMRTYEP